MLARLITLAGLAVLAGCAVEVEDVSQPAHASQALWTPSTSTLADWPDGRIEVCFGAERWTRRADGRLWPEPMPTGSEAWLQQAAHIEDLIEQHFESIPGVDLDFYGFEACPEAEVGTFAGGLRITLRDDGSFNWAYRKCAQDEYYQDWDPTQPGHDGCSSKLWSPSLEAHIRTSRYGYDWGVRYDTAVLHEVTHVLGFKHEYDRTDQPLDHCEDTSEDPSKGPGTQSGLFLTEYDHGSITNQTYCGYDGKLSPMDELGLEIIYPGVFWDHGVSGRYPMWLGSGEVLLREDDAVATDWSARGALPEAFTNVWWYRDGGYASSATTYDASRIATSARMRAYFQDLRGAYHGTVEQAVRVDGYLHTALLHNML